MTVILSNPSLDKAKQFAGSPDLKDVMQGAGVEGPPQIQFVEGVMS